MPVKFLVLGGGCWGFLEGGGWKCQFIFMTAGIFSRRRKRWKTNDKKMVDFWCRFFTVYAEFFTVYKGHKRWKNITLLMIFFTVSFSRFTPSRFFWSMVRTFLGFRTFGLPRGLPQAFWSEHEEHQAKDMEKITQRIAKKGALLGSTRSSCLFRSVDFWLDQYLDNPATSLNKEVTTGGNSIWSFPSVSSLSDRSIWRSRRLF